MNKYFNTVSFKKQAIIVVLMFFVLGGVWVSFGWGPSNVSEAKSFFSNSSEKEQKFLSYLCTELVHNSTMGYTLFGDKPMSLVSNECPPYLDRQYFFLNLAIPLIDRYEQKLSSKGFCIIVERQSETDLIYLINKRSFCNTVQENIDIFQDVLGNDVTPERLLRSITESRSVESALRGNEALYGLLFGFGRTNSLLFERRSQIEQRCSTPPWRDQLAMEALDDGELSLLHLQYKEISKQSNVSSTFFSCPKFDAIRDEYLELNRRLTSTCQFDSLPISRYSIGLPGFVGDPQSEETKQLMEKYRKQRNEIKSIVSGDDFLKKVVEKFYE